METVQIFNSEIYEDERGKIISNNNLNYSSIKRVYMINHSSTTTIRAWQGHFQETKFFRCIKGEFLVAWKYIGFDIYYIDDSEADYIIITENCNSVIKIPKGYANGLKALKNDSSIMVFSDFCLETSISEKIRFNKNMWFNWSDF